MQADQATNAASPVLRSRCVICGGSGALDTHHVCVTCRESFALVDEQMPDLTRSAPLVHIGPTDV